MRRALTAAAGTVAGLGALLSFKTTAAPRRAVNVATSSGLATETPTTTPDSPTKGSKAAPTTSTTQAEKTATGPVEQNRYGPVQVRVTVRGSTLVDVEAVQLPTDRQRSADISDQVAPMLRQEALAAQSANIDLISGATYTSQSYAQSLQAAIDAARQ